MIVEKGNRRPAKSGWRYEKQCNKIGGKRHEKYHYIIMLLAAVLLFPNLSYAEGNGKSEIMALVGMRIPPVVPGKSGGDIPRLQSMGSSLLIGLGPPIFGMEEGFINKESGFIVVKFESDLTTTILDGRTVPQALMSYKVVDGKGDFSEKRIRKYRITPCEVEATGERVIGLMRPEHGKEDCGHWSRQVKKAWRLNTQSEKLEDISPKGILCYRGSESECE